MTGGIDGIHVRTNLGTSNLLMGDGTPSDELIIVPINVEPFNIIYYAEESYPFKSVIPTKSIKTITISLTDKFNNNIDFNNIPFTLFLEIDFNFIDKEMDASSKKFKIEQNNIERKINLQKKEAEMAKRAVLNDINLRRKDEQKKNELVQTIQNFHDENK
jgi:hypothetical protein